MEESTDSQREHDEPTHPPAHDASPLADIISLETVVNVLIRKGLCTPEELFEEEQKRRQYHDEVKNISVVETGNKASEKNNKSGSRRKQTWLKRKMSKRRWTRRMGTRLFGWRWKKVKHPKEKSETPVSQVENSE